jgi:hypothetical protein
VAIHDFTTNEIVSAATMDTLLQVIAGGSYTPTLTAVTTNPTLGTGSVRSGRYLHVGSSSGHEWVIYQFDIKFGSSGAAAGSGTYFVDLPVAAAATAPLVVGAGEARDISGNIVHVLSVRFDTTTQIAFYYSGGTGSRVSAAIPWTWANDDELRGFCIYRVA